jgi:hypothetical protein
VFFMKFTFDNEALSKKKNLLGTRNVLQFYTLYFSFQEFQIVKVRFKRNAYRLLGGQPEGSVWV